jgi:alpha-ribazole phosphatase
MRVFLLRHGETYGNINHEFAGFTDTMLTEKGIQQAKDTHPKLVGESFDVVYASSLTRAVDTALYASDKEPVKIDGLKEMNFGIFEGLTYKTIQEKYPEEVKKWERLKSDYNFETGESLKAFFDRVISTYKDLRSTQSGDLLIVAHSGVIRSIIAHEISRGFDDYWKYQIDNCGLAVIRYLDDFPILEALNK